MRPFNDWELELVVNLLSALQKESVRSEMDKVIWKGEKGDSFSVREAYKVLQLSPGYSFPEKGMWVSCAPIKTAIFAWEASWGRVLTLDKFQRRGWQGKHHGARFSP